MRHDGHDLKFIESINSFNKKFLKEVTEFIFINLWAISVEKNVGSKRMKIVLARFDQSIMNFKMYSFFLETFQHRHALRLR